MSADHYQELARLIEVRRKERGYRTVGAFNAAVGKSDQAVLNIRTGKVRDYSDDLKWAVCDALWWRRDSIDRILAGKKPVPIDGPPTPPQQTPDAELSDRLGAIEGRQREGVAAIADLLERAEAASVQMASVLARLAELERWQAEQDGNEAASGGE